MSKDADSIAIIGAGIMGWSAAAELVRRGILPKIIDTVPPGGYASTGNQGWMQSGALYLAKSRPDVATAKYCRAGYHYMMGRNTALIHHEISCFFLFYHQEQCQSVIERCLGQDIPARAIPITEISEPLLQRSDLRYAAVMPDHPFDNALLLQSFARQACDGGAQFYPATSLETIEVKKHGDGLLISLGGDQQIECKGLILACGAMIPAFLERLYPGQEKMFSLTKSPVLVLRSDITLARSMLIPPRELDGPNLVPFQVDGGNGVTVCIPSTDQPITDYHDRTQDHEHLRAFASSLSNFYTGITSLAAEHTILAHIYCCQKLHLRADLDQNMSSRRTIFSSYALEPGAPKNIYIVSPGKATAAPILAEECARQLAREIKGLHIDFDRPPTTPPTMAKQLYCDEAKLRLVVENRMLRIRPRP